MKTCFSGTQKSSICGVWTAPGPQKTTPKGFWGPRGRQDPLKSMIYGSKKNKFLELYEYEVEATADTRDPGP